VGVATKPPKSGRELAEWLADPDHRLVLVSGHEGHPPTFAAIVESFDDHDIRVRRVPGNKLFDVAMPARWIGGPGDRRSAQQRRYIEQYLKFDDRGFTALGVRVTYLDDKDPFR
jgi:hypothetical protein